MGRKTKLPPLLPSISPILEPDYQDSRRLRLPPISNGAIVTNHQGWPKEPIHVRADSDHHHKTTSGRYISKVPSPLGPVPRSNGPPPYLNNRDMATRRPVISQIDLRLQQLRDMPTTSLRVHRRNVSGIAGTNRPIHLSPPDNADYSHIYEVPNLTIQGHRIPSPFGCSSCAGMDDFVSDFSSELTSLGDINRWESMSRPKLIESKVPPLDLRQLRSPCLTPPGVFAPRESHHDDLSSPEQSSVPRLPTIKKKKRFVKDDQL